MDNIKFAIEYLIKNTHKMVEENNNYAVQTSNMAIEALEKQLEIIKILKDMENINDYDIRLVGEVKDLLKEFLID